MTMEPPKAAIRAFNEQRRNAKQRGIPFLLTLEEWWGWWQTDNRWAQRGRRKDLLVMARLGDVGPYALDNVYCSTNGDNLLLGYMTCGGGIKAAEGRRKADNFAHLRDRPKHPRCRRVISPAGVFPSIALAAEANGLTAHYAQKLAAAGSKGWGYS